VADPKLDALSDAIIAALEDYDTNSVLTAIVETLEEVDKESLPPEELGLLDNFITKANLALPAADGEEEGDDAE